MLCLLHALARERIVEILYFPCRMSTRLPRGISTQLRFVRAFLTFMRHGYKMRLETMLPVIESIVWSPNT